jgi:hypothetical protein
MNVGCRTCAASLEHCHGTVIRHLLHRVECTDDGCPGPGLILHEFALDCAAIGCRCAQPIGSAVERASSASG